jgi:hypothetical protein
MRYPFSLVGSGAAQQPSGMRRSAETMGLIEEIALRRPEAKVE